jgi:hypothetical protein
MSKIIWDAIGEKLFELGIDRGVLYPRDVNGAYPLGVGWNGLTGVTESPGGAELTDLWADNRKYASMRAAETFAATIEAFTYPDEFAACDGSAELAAGVMIGQQGRDVFGFSYRTLIGNDVDGADGEGGYMLHLVYGAEANPSEKAYATVNDSPDAITFSWEVVTTPVPVTGHKPTACLTINSNKVGAPALAALEDILYGVDGVAPRLPLPDEVASLMLGESAAPVTAPTFVAATGVLTIPTKVGVVYQIDGVTIPAGPMAAIDGGVSVHPVAIPATGYYFPAGTNDNWDFVSTKP